jgi:hypothetical protein
MKAALIVDERIEHNLKMVNEVIESVPLLPRFTEAKSGREKRRERRKQERSQPPKDIQRDERNHNYKISD